MHTFFHHIGLTQNEETIYLYLLEYGSAIASIIAQRLGINRVTVYASLKAMIKKGFVKTYQKNKVTYFEAASPEDLFHAVKERVARQQELEREAEEILPGLKQLQERQTKPVLEVKGELKYYQGLDAVNALINETLDEPKKEQLCFGLNKFHIQHKAGEWKSYTERRVEKGMFVRSIQPNTDAAVEYQSRDQKELRRTLLVPHKKFPADCELNIIGDMIALVVTHGEKPSGMKITHRDMARVLRSLFELAWESAERYEGEARV